MIKYKPTYKSFVALLVLIVFNSCIEPFQATFVDFESALVIEATITNELKTQQVVLSRSYEFDADGPTAETGARVMVIGGGTTYNFIEGENGIYFSDQQFAAQQGVEYTLQITTSDGRNYGSDNTQLTAATSLDEVKAERITNDLGEEGMAILVDSFDPSGNSVNYRYEYEETYRVIAPTWSPVSLIGDPDNSLSCLVLKVNNETDERICYPTSFSNSIILNTTDNLDEDRVSNFMVRFINRDNYIISHRYSILVRQYVMSNESYNFFETLNELSGSESLFSQTQPGFLQGNVFSADNEEERVLGYFDVASVDEKRLFFNYDDFFPGEDLPPYVDPCNPSSPVLANMGGCVLRPIIESGAGVYFLDTDEPGINEGPYQIVPRVCGDCKVLGPPEVPDFWME